VTLIQVMSTNEIVDTTTEEKDRQYSHKATLTVAPSQRHQRWRKVRSSAECAFTRAGHKLRMRSATRTLGHFAHDSRGTEAFHVGNNDDSPTPTANLNCPDYGFLFIVATFY
jgi:hypothetical protein